MAKGIYVGVSEEQVVKGDIIPKTWTEVTAGSSYISEDGIKLTASSATKYTPDSAFDGDEDTFFGPSGSGNKYIKLEFPTAIKITKMKINISTGSTSSVSSCYLQASSNGSNWYKQYDLTGTSGWVECELSNPMEAKYYRIYCTKSSADYLPYVYEWQVSEYVKQETNIARKAKKVYVGVTVAGDNLISNGDFSNGVSGWYYDDTNSYGALELSAVNNALTVNLVKSNTNNNIIKTEANINTASGHVYYARLEAKSNSSNDFRFYATLAGSPNISTNDLVKDGEWHILSLRGATGEHSYPFMLSCYQPDKGNTVECRNIAVYDLTAMFGAGNEPTQEWCDNNLYAVIGKGVARKVKKGYIGVSKNLITNGDFNNGLTGWVHSNSANTNITYTIEDGWLVATCNTSYSDNASFDALYQNTYWQTNHKYYLCYKGKVLNYVKNADSSTTLGVHFSSGNVQNNLDLSILNEEQIISGLYTWTSTEMERKAATALRKVEAGTKVAFTGIRTFDLTALYGAGNEPDKAWCDANLEELNKSVARLFFSVEQKLEYYGTATALAYKKYSMGATTVGNYALFGGGYNNSNRTASVDTYTSSLVKGTATNLSKQRSHLAATTVGDYAVFGGGQEGSGRSAVVDAYSKTLVKSTPTVLGRNRNNLAATAVGNYAIFGGGYWNGACSNTDAYSSGLVKTTISSLNAASDELAAASVGDYAIFSGATMTSYTSSLVVGTPTSMSLHRSELAATSVGNYALFGGGISGSLQATVEAYSSSLVKTTAATLSELKTGLTATSIGDFAIFAGGATSSGYSAKADKYTSSLVKSKATALSAARDCLASASVGNYALFVGGRTDSSTYSDVVDVYQLVE